MRTLPLALLLVAAACKSRYLTPGPAADLECFADPGIEAALERRPAARWPAHLAVVRVQGPGYASRTARGYGVGGFSVVPTRDVETDDQLDRLRRLPGVAGMGTVSRLLLPARLDSPLDLRRAAASLQADLVYLYTFDTCFEVDCRLRPATLVSLGLFPNRKARVHATASALVVDTRTGYVYGTVEASAHREKIANAWSSAQAVDDSRRAAERDAFEGLVAETERLWPSLVASHAGTAPGRNRYATGSRRRVEVAAVRSRHTGAPRTGPARLDAPSRP